MIKSAPKHEAMLATLQKHRSGKNGFKVNMTNTPVI